VRASTRLTHRDPRAETAALAVAEAAAWIVRRGAGGGAEGEAQSEPSQVGSDDGVIQWVRVSEDPEWVAVCTALECALIRGDAVTDFAASLGLTRGVTGYAYHTVPVALYAWLRHRGDFQTTLVAAIRCGGDTDTVAAIAGALAGCEVAEQGIPARWRHGLWDWPRSPRLLNRLAEQLAATDGLPVRWFWPGVLARNVFFLAVVLFHGFRRLFPPY
ncbi:MAG: ADP-ribosylglycohydrolase family protein, partial [Verrucomicrobia bacterium]|nr:ADP-ribosylglycohydrolase family protein [Verrucomicrobiota bacterium]